MQINHADSTQKRTRDPDYYWERPMLTFAVENTLFRLPRKEFEHQSSVFCDLFSLPARSIPGSAAEGSSDDNPIYLHSIKEIDFRRLSMVLFPEKYKKPQGHEEWISVLKLSTMWDFIHIKKKALIEVSATLNDMAPLDRILLAKEYKIPRWLFEAYFALVKQDEPITQREVDTLGLDAVYRLLQIREVSWRKSRGSRYRNFEGLEQRVVHDFYGELKDLDYCGLITDIPSPVHYQY